MNTQEKFVRKVKPRDPKSTKRKVRFLRLTKKERPPNIRHIYLVTEERKTAPDIPHAYMTYGLCVMEISGHRRRVIRRVSDISTDKSRIIQMAARCNRYQLDPIHLDDIIADELATPI